MTKRLQTLKTLKIISLVLFCLITAALVFMYFYTLIDVVQSRVEVNKMDLTGLGVVAVMILTEIICLAYLIPSIMSIVGLFLSKGIKSKKNKLFLIPMTLSPIIMGVINFVAYILMLNFVV